MALWLAPSRANIFYLRVMKYMEPLHRTACTVYIMWVDLQWFQCRQWRGTWQSPFLSKCWWKHWKGCYSSHNALLLQYQERRYASGPYFQFGEPGVRSWIALHSHAGPTEKAAFHSEIYQTSRWQAWTTSTATCCSWETQRARKMQICIME